MEIPREYSHVLTSVQELHALRDVFSTLFFNKGTVALLKDRGAGFAAWAIQRTMIDSIMMLICRLCDDPGAPPKEKLTLDRLLDALPSSKFKASDIEEMKETVRAIKMTANNLQQQRHRRIAHTSLSDAFANWAPLPKVTRKQIDKIAALLGSLMNKIGRRYGRGTDDFRIFGAAESAANLIEYFRLGAEADRICIGLKGTLDPCDAVQQLRLAHEADATPKKKGQRQPKRKNERSDAATARAPSISAPMAAGWAPSRSAATPWASCSAEPCTARPRAKSMRR